MLITAGPTHEPIDAVRFIGNRSSGRLGMALADCAAGRGMAVTLLLGPVCGTPANRAVHMREFRTCEELRGLLRDCAPNADTLIMAAAVADYRPKIDASRLDGKVRRQDQNLILELEPTPDLLAETAASRRPGQFLVGFALEPRAKMIASAKRKLEHKRVDLIVANPLETMDSAEIDAVVIDVSGSEYSTAGPMSKEAFAPWLLDVISRARK